MTPPTRSIRAPLVAAMVALATAGCAAVGPNFKPPAPPSTTGYVPPGEATAARTRDGLASDQTIALGDKVTADWWTLFRSPDLDALVKQAIAGSPTLESAKARLAEAREGVAEARSALYPQLSVGADFTRAKESATAFGLAPNRFP